MSSSPLNVSRIPLLRVDYPDRFWNFLRDYAWTWINRVKLPSSSLYKRYLYSSERNRLIQLLRALGYPYKTLKDPLFSNFTEVHAALAVSPETKLETGLQVGVDKTSEAIIATLREEATRVKAELSHLKDLVTSMGDALKMCREREDKMMEQLMKEEENVPPLPPPPPPMDDIVADAMQTIADIKPEQGIERATTATQKLSTTLQDEIRGGLKLKKFTPEEKQAVKEEASNLEKQLFAMRKKMNPKDGEGYDETPMDCSICSMPATHACSCMMVAQCASCVIPLIHDSICDAVETYIHPQSIIPFVVSSNGQYKILAKTAKEGVAVKLTVGTPYKFVLHQDMTKHPAQFKGKTYTRMGEEIPVVLTQVGETAVIQCIYHKDMKIKLVGVV